MAKDTAAASSKQAFDNPTVLIRYDPENALALLATDARKTLASLAVAKIATPNELESASAVLQVAELRADQIENFKATLREKVQNAASRFREIPGFEDFEVTLTIRRWNLNSLLSDAIRNLKNMRAQYLAEEDRKLKQKQLAAQAEQDRLNKIAADNAAKAAKAAGADKATVADIKQSVLATPAPIVESKAQTVADNVGASLRYGYTAKIGDLGTFLKTCLANKTFLVTLMKAIPEMEKAFGPMARDQKEQFEYPGIKYVKTPIDVSRR